MRKATFPSVSMNLPLFGRAVLIERCKNFREARLALIVKRAARLIGALVELTRFLVRQLKRRILADVLIVRLREMIVLVLPIGWSADG
jgi:hypothetical protein